MGACATKPMAQGDAPLPLEQPLSPRGSEEENARKEEEMVAAAGRDTKQGTPDKNEQKSVWDLLEVRVADCFSPDAHATKDGEISEPTETDKHVVSETAAPETVEVKEEEVMEHNEMDEAAEEDGTEEEQLVEIFESEEPEEAVANVTPLKTSAPSLPTDSEGASDSQVKAADQIAKVESIPKDGPADEGKKGDVFSALFNAYNNLLNKT
ncbi:hypothetical protein B296_00055558 [Ensete ventricosum]|uniref:Uncharacterized protein n=1 Tax=Ensete ventricosum TaxID=4639 RepID=A0A426X5P4_ENSVE|nr:hypothetical protein B296_00055558 [Ensete ventricosum]